MADHALEQDIDFLRSSTRIVALWITILVVGGLALLLGGDALMALAT